MRPVILLIAASLLLAGCSSPEADPLSSTTIAPDSTGHVLLQLEAAGDPQAVTVNVADDAGLTVLLPDRFHHDGTAAAAWIGFTAPADASGAHEVVLDVTGATRERVSISVHVEDDEGLGEGAVALVDYVVRTADGIISANTRADVEASPLERSQDYQALPEPAPQPVQLSPQLGPELLEPLASLGIGHSVTIDLGDVYGAPHEEQEQPREESIERRTSMPRFEEMPRQQAEQQGIIDGSTQEGDTIDGGAFTYIVETLDETTLRVEIDVDEGDRVTVYDAWPDATVVEERNAEEVVFRTDAPVAEGEPFTWRPEWPEATQVVSMDDTAIVLRHSPEVGHKYQAQTQQGPADQEIIAVHDDVIVINQTNPHPLAGRTIFMEATLVGEEENPAPAVPQP